MEDITDADYTHLKRIYKDFQWKTWGKFLDLYVQSNTFLLADVFESFRKMCLETNEFMAKVKLDFLTDIETEEKKY